MTIQRDPQLISRIVEMRDAGMTRAQARFTLDMGEHKFRTILHAHSISDGWAKLTPERKEANRAQLATMLSAAKEKRAWVLRMLAKMTPEERAMYRSLRRRTGKGQLSVGRALEAVIKARREAA